MKTFYYYEKNGMGWITGFGIAVTDSKQSAILAFNKKGIRVLENEIQELLPNHLMSIDVS